MLTSAQAATADVPMQGAMVLGAVVGVAPLVVVYFGCRTAYRAVDARGWRVVVSVSCKVVATLAMLVAAAAIKGVLGIVLLGHP